MSGMYETLKDEELIDRLRDGENQITDYIMDKYKYLVRKKRNLCTYLAQIMTI